jgi:transposase
MNDKQLFTALLGIEAPWYVDEVQLQLVDGDVVVRLEVEKSAKLLCPTCGEAAPRYDRTDERRWRHLDTCQYRTMIAARLPRVKCATHGVLQVKVPWADGHSRFTAMFEAWAIRVLKETATLSATAELLKLTWDEADGIFIRAVSRGLVRRTDEPVRAIGIDETSFQKRHEYVTIALDLEGDRVLWVGDGRRQATLESFWRCLTPEQREAVEVVTMDMWDPYVAATRTSLPDGLSKIVFDRYHVMSHINRAVDQVRKSEHRERMSIGDNRLHRTKYDWLRGEQTRTPETEAYLHELRAAGFKVGRAWAIKEAARGLWTAANFADAMSFYRKWYFWATHSRLAPVITAANTVKYWLWGILRYHVHRFTNAKTEGVNAKIQELKRRAKGYRNRDNFRYAILFHCGGLSMDP